MARRFVKKFQKKKMWPLMERLLPLDFFSVFLEMLKATVHITIMTLYLA